MKNVLLLGSGGREHALAHILSKSPRLGKLYVAPGNPGTAQFGQNVPVAATDFPAIHQLVLEHNISLIVCGPEDPLVAGVYDYFNPLGIPVVGPSRAAAQLEGSKSFAKAFMARNHIPTASYREFDIHSLADGIAWIDQQPSPYVLKADGLAAGKGVVIHHDKEEAKIELQQMIAEAKFGQASAKVVVEGFLEGIEFSVFVLTDGKDYLMLPQAKDYKRIGEGDTGLNTGGMGAVSPVPFVSDALMQQVERDIVKPTIQGLSSENLEYKGFLYFGLIQTASGPQVIEYNCRMGDPETEVVMPRIQSDLLPVMFSLFDGSLSSQSITIDPRFAVTVVVATAGYPKDFPKGLPLSWEQQAECFIYQAGTREEQGQLYSSGGRVLAITSLERTIPLAVTSSIKQAEMIQFPAKYFRRDIGHEFF